MDWEQRCLRLCAGVLISAALLRLCAGGNLTVLGKGLETPEVASFLVYLQTGRVVRVPIQTAPPVSVSLPTEPLPSDGPVSFSAADAQELDIRYNCSKTPDIAALLTQELAWDLTADGPTVLILHTHTTESYTKTDGAHYAETSPYRTLDPEHNLLCLGELVAGILEEAGIGVLHDTQFHDYPSYNGSYSHAKKSTTQILEQYPSIRLILDIHRDAADTAAGQLATHCRVDGQDSAQIMFVVGTDQNLSNPNWEDNLSLALKLQTILEKNNPGICRNLNLTAQRYNQHLGDRALLIEIGAAGDTLEEAKIAAAKLAEAIAALKYGSVSPD